MRKLDNRDVVALNTLKQMGYTQVKLASMFNVSPRDVSYHVSPESKKTTQRYNKKYAELKKERA